MDELTSDTIGGASPGGPESIVDHRLVEEMQDSYLTYSMSVIMSIGRDDSARSTIRE